MNELLLEPVQRRIIPTVRTSHYVLRPYQDETADRCVAGLMAPRPENGIAVLPTGSGKSLVIASVVSRLDGPAIVFQPSKEILEQNLQKLRSYGFSPAVFSASAGSRRIGDITLATIGSVFRNHRKFAHVRYVIVDEAHLVNSKKDDSMFMQFLAGLPDVRVLGLTATPYRLTTDGYGGSILKFITRTRPRVFTKVWHVVQNGDLFRAGHLARLEYKVVKTGFDRSRLRLNSTGADYTDESVRNHFATLNFSDQIVRCVSRLHELGRRGTLVFTRFVEEAEYVARRVPGAAIVTAKTTRDERERIIREFRAGRIPVVSNVGVFTIGFDYPELANVILARPTRSLALYYQMVGRSVRPHPAKEAAYVVDMVGLSSEFGHVEDLELREGTHERWAVWSGGRQLTNVYFGNNQVRSNAAGERSPAPKV